MDTLSSLLQFGLLAPLGVIVLILLLILIHELGHFVAGRYFGVGVDEFSLGFGSRLVSWYDARGTLWSLRALPLGGFVKFLGDGDAASGPKITKPDTDRPMNADQPMDAGKRGRAGTDVAANLVADVGAGRAADVAAGRATLAQLPIWQRAIVVAAGPLANLVLALVLFTVHMAFVGRDLIDPIVGHVEPGSAAALAGLEPEDRIVSFAGTPIDNFVTLNLQFETNLGQSKPLSVLRDGQVIALSITPASGKGQQTSANASGLWPRLALSVLAVEPGSAAEAMGLIPGDLIHGYDGRPLFRWQDFAQARADKIGEPMALHVERGDQMLILTGIPEARTIERDDGTSRIDGVFGFHVGLAVDRARIGLGAALRAAAGEMRQFSLLIFKLPAQFIRQQRSLDDLGGPVRIAEEVGRVVVFAPSDFLFMAGLLSLQLGLINLFPIPVLDGGHLLLYTAEAILRRPLPAALTIWLMRMGGFMLLAFFVFVTVNDLARLVG